MGRELLAPDTCDIFHKLYPTRATTLKSELVEFLRGAP